MWGFWGQVLAALAAADGGWRLAADGWRLAAGEEEHLVQDSFHPCREQFLVCWTGTRSRHLLAEGRFRAMKVASDRGGGILELPTRQ